MKNIILLLSVFLVNATGCKSKSETPTCIQEKIIEISSAEISNPPAKIYQVKYNDVTVYYVTSKCCDIPSALYDANCNKICSPDGGFTGKDDGKCTDFFDARTNEKLIWEDERKQNNKKKQLN